MTLYSVYFHAKKGRPQPTVEKTIILIASETLCVVPPGMQLREGISAEGGATRGSWGRATKARQCGRRARRRACCLLPVVCCSLRPRDSLLVRVLKVGGADLGRLAGGDAGAGDGTEDHGHGCESASSRAARAVRPFGTDLPT